MSSEEAVDPRLLSDTASVVDGVLEVGGVSVLELAEHYGTPLFIYDEAHLRARCREAVRAWGEGVAFATKAFLCRAMARLAAEEGMCLDVATGGELHVALAAGVEPARIIVHGNNKSDAELSRAIELGVRHVVVDNFDEINRIERLATAPVRVMLRVTPGIEAHTHEFVRTGQEDSKFGFSIASGAAARGLEQLARIAAVSVTGIHAHIGSQVFELSSFEQSAAILAEFFNPLGLEELCVGGGLGVAYVNGESAPSIADWAKATSSACAAAGVADSVRISAEPGRAIVAAAALTAYRIGSIKRLTTRTYVAVDGGMSDNPRPVLYGSGYEAFLPRSPGAPRPMAVRLVGKHCESGDVIVADGRLPGDAQVGDIVATPVTGAYGYSMASNYNKVPRPPVIFVADGVARVVVRGETLDDLLTLDA